MKHARLILVFLALAVLLPAITWLVINAGDLAGVAQSGICPSAPPDIPPYPCTVGEYLLRMTLGPWALIGNLFVCCGWWVILGVGLGMLLLVRRAGKR